MNRRSTRYITILFAKCNFFSFFSETIYQFRYRTEYTLEKVPFRLFRLLFPFFFFFLFFSNLRNANIVPEYLTPCQTYESYQMKEVFSPNEANIFTADAHVLGEHESLLFCFRINYVTPLIGIQPT